MASNRQKDKDETEKLKATLPTEAEKKQIENLAAEKNKEIRENIDITLDETKRSVNKTMNEAKDEVPKYSKAVNEYQQETIQAMKDIADNFLESQKEVIRSMRALSIPYNENVQNSYASYWVSPQSFTENYARAVSNITESLIAATRLWNNILFASMDAWKNSMQHARDNAIEFSRLSTNVANTYENTARENLREYERRSRRE